ncbi:hypothetical protein TNCV_3563721 [Trichonephila clavipes]|nr:hypothetical protein TNCV_3563721 [Trichonephila clavipes]
MVNARSYIKILTHFKRRLRSVRPQHAQQSTWFIVHDNAHPHTASIVKQFLAKKGMGQIEHHSSRLLPIRTTQTRFERIRY